MHAIIKLKTRTKMHRKIREKKFKDKKKRYSVTSYDTQVIEAVMPKMMCVTESCPIMEKMTDRRNEL